MTEGLLEPVKVAAPWMDERSHGMLREFFRVGLKSRCVLVEPERAQAIIIDVDRGDATRRLHEARQRWPDAPVIELSVNHTDQALFVRKPLRPKGMARALQSVRRRLHLHDDPVTESVGSDTADPVTESPPVAAAKPIAPRGPVPEPGTESHYVGQANDLDPDAPDTWYRAFYDPDEYFQGHLTQAVSMAQTAARSVAMTGLWGSWIIPPDNGPVLQLSMPDHHLRSLCLATMGARDVRFELIDDAPPADATPRVNRDSLLWKVTLWTARGRVPKGTPLDEPVYLRHWPDLNTLLVTPDAMRIAALWLNHPISIRSLAAHLSVPQRHVFSFYSACAAIGLAGPARRASDTLVDAPRINTTGMRNLIGRLCDKLGLGVQTESI